MTQTPRSKHASGNSGQTQVNLATNCMLLNFRFGHTLLINAHCDDYLQRIFSIYEIYGAKTSFATHDEPILVSKCIAKSKICCRYLHQQATRVRRPLLGCCRKDFTKLNCSVILTADAILDFVIRHGIAF